MALPRELAAKLSKPIRLLTSNSQGEAFAALCAIARLLESHGYSFHTLADHVENTNGSGLTDELKQMMRAAIDQAHAQGFAEGVRATEAKQHGAGAFRNTDGTPDWKDIARWLQREKHRLDAKHHKFIDGMASRSAWDLEPTRKQHQYLHSLFYRLGGKIT